MKLNFGCLELYQDDLIKIVKKIDNIFKEYKLRLDIYEITNKDNIESDLEEIKSESIEIIHDLKLNSSLGSYFEDDYIDLTIKINKDSAYIYTHHSNTLIRGIIGEIEDILNKRTKKFGTIMKSPYFILGSIILIILYILNILFFKLSYPFLFEVSTLIFYTVIILIWLDIILKLSKNKIYLLKYNEKSSWYSKNIKPHLSTLIIGIISATIGGIIVVLFSDFLM